MTQHRTMDKLDELESALRKPVVTSNQCSLWAGLQLTDAPPAVKAPGALFRR